MLGVIGIKRSAVVAVVGFLAMATVAGPPSPLAELAGRYTHKFKNGDVSGDTYFTTDVVEIAPLDAQRATISFYLNFFNGHSCSVYGVATLEQRKLVYREKSDLPDEPDCKLEIWRDRSKLRWEDNGTCRFHCGARGGLSNGNMRMSSRQSMHGQVPRRPDL